MRGLLLPTAVALLLALPLIWRAGEAALAEPEASGPQISITGIELR